MEDINIVNELTQEELQNFKNVCEHLRSVTPTSDIIYTWPDILGRRFKENSISAWLAFLLNPNKNGFDVQPLNAMLSLIKSADYFIENGEDIEVETEYTFEGGRRIDIFITTEQFVIGIENKIFSGEGEDQTSDYWNSINEIYKATKKIPVCLFLTPQGSIPPKDKNFTHITFFQLCEVFKSIPYDYRRDSRKNSIFF
jgi:hypothetical protein